MAKLEADKLEQIVDETEGLIAELAAEEREAVEAAQQAETQRKTEEDRAAVARRRADAQEQQIRVLTNTDFGRQVALMPAVTYGSMANCLSDAELKRVCAATLRSKPV